MNRARRLAISVAGLLAITAAIGCTPRSDNSWHYKTYGTADWRQDASGTIFITASTPLSGLFARIRNLDEGAYRLRVKGALISGEALLKITQRNRPPSWSAVPDGEHTMVVEGGGPLELLFYSEGAFNYQLAAIAIEPHRSSWRPRVYGQTSWEVLASDRLAVTVDKPPGGLYFHSNTGSGLPTRIRLEGKPLRGTATVRVTAGNSAPRWLAAPDGDLHINLPGGPIELLLYGDASFSYELRSLTFHACSACLDDAGMRDFLKKEIVGLDFALAHSPLDAAALLLDWAANTVDLGWLSADRSAAFSSLPAAQVYQDFWVSDSAGSSCSGFATFYSDLLELFSIPAFTLDMGYPGSSLTHVTTVLVTGTAPDFKFYLMDPTLNGRYVKPDGSAADLSLILQGLVTPGFAYRFATSGIKRDVIYKVQDRSELSGALRSVGYDEDACVRSQSVAEDMGICKDVPYALPFLMHTWEKVLRRQGVTPKPDLLLRLLTNRVISATGAAAAELESFRQLLSKHGIPYGSA